MVEELRNSIFYIVGIQTAFIVTLACLGAFCYNRLQSHQKVQDGLEHLGSRAERLEKSMINALKNGTIVLLKCAWIAANIDEGSLPKMDRRQDLPPAAFFTAAEAVDLYERGLVYVLSYGW